jgi:hypothetical protein
MKQNSTIACFDVKYYDDYAMVGYVIFEGIKESKVI